MSTTSAMLVSAGAVVLWMVVLTVGLVRFGGKVNMVVDEVGKIDTDLTTAEGDIKKLRSTQNQIIGSVRRLQDDYTSLVRPIVRPPVPQTNPRATVVTTGRHSLPPVPRTTQEIPAQS